MKNFLKGTLLAVFYWTLKNKYISRPVVEPSVPKPTSEATRSAPERIFLKCEFEQILGDFTIKIHQNNSNTDLEQFFATVFRNVHEITEVKENGYGGTDYGADLIVKYTSERIQRH